MEPSSDQRANGHTRRRLLQAAGVAATAGLAGCAEFGGEPTSQPDVECEPVEPAADVSEYATHPDDDVSMFGRGLRRLNYYPDESVPEAVEVNWETPINYVGHTAAKSSHVPTREGDTILIAGDTGRVDAYCPDGQQKWSTQTSATEKGFHGSPAIVGDTAYIGGYDGDLYALDVASGEIVWHTPAPEFGGTLAIGSSPAYYEGSLYLIAEYGNPSTGALWEVDPETGEPLWSDRRIWGQPHPSPTIDLDLGLIMAGSNDGVVYCWDFPSLEFRWEFQADADGREKEDGAFRAGAEIKGTVAAHDGRGYVGSWDNNLYCLDLTDGTEEWSIDTGGSNMSNPAVDTDENVVYTGSDSGIVRALDAVSGDELWRTDVNGRVLGGVTATAGKLLVGSYDSYLYALDRETGDRCWRVENRGRVTSTPLALDGRVYYAERAVFSNYYDDDAETVLETPGHAYCLREAE